MNVSAELLNQIRDAYQSCSQEERNCLIRILTEFSEYGTSETYENIWMADYKEIPVSIETFICDPRFLGNATRNGDAIYPAWWDAYYEIFNNGNKYDEIVLTGATRIGKSSTGITATAYMLYRLMCLRDPQAFFGKKDVSIFSILFFNVTKDLAQGVAFREFNDTLKVSPWFCAHGTFSKSERNFYYIPDGGKITIDFGSDASHGLGKQVYCLVGSTEILTQEGYRRLDALADSQVAVGQWSEDLHRIFYTSASVCLTKYVNSTTRVILSDGSVLEGTCDHPVLLVDGSYKNLGDLTCSDSLFSIDSSSTGLKVSEILTQHHVDPVPVYDVVDAQPYHNFIVHSHSDLVVHNCGFMDEINFARAGIKDVNKAKERMQDTYNTISARIKGTFRKNGEIYGKLFAISSKKSDSDFLEDHIAKQIESGNGDHMYVFDRPQWQVLPPSMFHKERFYIAIGNRHQHGFVVPENQSTPEGLADIEKQGFKLLDVPIDMKPEFVADFDIALRDLAGISVPGALSFITQATLTACINNSRKNPFFSDILEIGTQSTHTIEEFFHLEVVNPQLKRCPLYIHYDLSLNTDRSGISGVCISGRKDINTPDGKVVSLPAFTHIFTVALQAPRGDKIPYHKILEFTLWLRRSGFNLAMTSRDQFQSEYLGELLESNGITSEKLSLDRTPDGYDTLKSVLLEQRIDMLDCELLQHELIHLQRDAFSGVCDHPIGGCFVGDTHIQLVDGRNVSILQLLDEQSRGEVNWVYTVNEDIGKIEPKRIRKVFQTKLTESLVRVTLDNEQSVLCTPEHRFMLHDGSYSPAIELECGTSLMSLYTKYRGRDAIKKQNHKVVSVEPVTLPCRVYDLEIEDNHNFALSCGVFVHNSKDTADSFAGAVWNAIRHNGAVPVPATKVASAIAAVSGSKLSTGRNSTTAALPSMFPNLSKKGRR